jgi:hypothetical protein
MSQSCNVLTAKDTDPAFTHCLKMRPFSAMMGLSGMFQSLRAQLMRGQVILLVVVFRSATVSLSGGVMQFGGALVICRVRSALTGSRHPIRLSILPDFSMQIAHSTRGSTHRASLASYRLTGKS